MLRIYRLLPDRQKKIRRSYSTLLNCIHIHYNKNMSLLNTKNILIVIVLIVIIAAGYYYFTSSAPIPVSILVPTTSEVAGEDILVLVEKLKKVSIDSSLFSGALFSSLKD